jgi:hypothetical protein
MTKEEKFTDLGIQFQKAGERLMKAQKDLTSFFGWGDSTELSEFLEAKREFEEISKEYHDFLVQQKDGR